MNSYHYVITTFVVYCILKSTNSSALLNFNRAFPALTEQINRTTEQIEQYIKD